MFSVLHVGERRVSRGTAEGNHFIRREPGEELDCTLWPNAIVEAAELKEPHFLPAATPIRNASENTHESTRKRKKSSDGKGGQRYELQEPCRVRATPTHQTPPCWFDGTPVETEGSKGEGG